MISMPCVARRPAVAGLGLRLVLAPVSRSSEGLPDSFPHEEPNARSSQAKEITP
jgi:hypothetical protein